MESSNKNKKLSLNCSIRIKPCSGTENAMTNEKKWERGIISVNEAPFGPFSSVISQDGL